jgi:uncharacterized cupin superfamily protein
LKSSGRTTGLKFLTAADIAGVRAFAVHAKDEEARSFYQKFDFIPSPTDPMHLVSIFESTPAKTNHRTRPTDVDEFVYVLSGKLILTETNGTRHEYRPGDSLVLPVGYTGTWEMQGNYRELVVEMQKGR